jgi:prephenate dehydrogenase
MEPAMSPTAKTTVGLMGFGAFGRLIAVHLRAHFQITVHDPTATQGSEASYEGVTFGSPEDVARCPCIILAVPMSEMTAALRQLRPQLRWGTTVIDVCSVKVRAVELMADELPSFVNIVGAHPLFGPQSARETLKGRKIAICPVRGGEPRRIAAFLRRAFGLKVFIATPEEHDREMALVQGVTHLIAKVLVRMGPLPQRLTTASFDRIMEATEMVRYDSPGVFMAIERENPYAADVRERFFTLANEARAELKKRN